MRRLWLDECVRVLAVGLLLGIAGHFSAAMAQSNADAERPPPLPPVRPAPDAKPQKVEVVSDDASAAPFLRQCPHVDQAIAFGDAAIGGKARRPSPPLTLWADGANKPVRIAAVGDILLHEPLLRQGFDQDGGFPRFFRAVEPFIAVADLAYANLEGPVARGMTQSGAVLAAPDAELVGRAYTGYPTFNYPPQALSALIGAGVDVVSLANNHLYDRGLKGVDLTLSALDDIGLDHFGARAPDGQAPRVAIIRARNGERIAWVGCATYFNGLEPWGAAAKRARAWHCYDDRKAVLAAVSAAACRPDVDATILAPHWGPEYRVSASEEQRRFGLQAVEAGATLVLGAHPHVIQEVEYVTDSHGRRSAIAFSLGNFISAQRPPERRNSVILHVNLARDHTGRLTPRQIEYIPIEMEQTGGRFQLTPRPADGLAEVDYRDRIPIGTPVSQVRQPGLDGLQVMTLAGVGSALTDRFAAVELLLDRIVALDATTDRLAAASIASARVDDDQRRMRRILDETTRELSHLRDAETALDAELAGLRRSLATGLARRDAALTSSRPNAASARLPLVARYVAGADELFDAAARLKPGVAADLARRLEAIVRARALKRWRLDVVGHADKRRVTTAASRSNRHLSANRAATVVQALENEGIGPNRLTAIGAGSMAPLADELSGAADRINRRVEFLLYGAPDMQ